MESLNEPTIEQKNFAIDGIITLVVDELASKTGKSPNDILNDFINSKTGSLFYDETSKLWANGPEYIISMYLDEHSKSFN